MPPEWPVSIIWLKAWMGPRGLEFKSNCLQMPIQRQCFLFSYLETLNVDLSRGLSIMLKCYTNIISFEEEIV